MVPGFLLVLQPILKQDNSLVPSGGVRADLPAAAPTCTALHVVLGLLSNQHNAEPWCSVHHQLEESKKMKQLLVRFVREDEGQDLVEYALLITFIALACIIGMQQLGTAI